MEKIKYATIENINDFEQIRTPDYALLANLVIRAKGPERVMSQFAEDAQIGASTLSRIINMNIKKPLSIENIIKIYEAREKKDDSMLLDALVRANGLFPKDYVKRVKDRDDVAARRFQLVNRERMMKNALIAGVVASGLPVTEVVNTPRISKNQATPIFTSRLGDFMLNIRSDLNLSKIKDWAFFLYPIFVENEDEYMHHYSIYMRRIMDQACKWFLLDAWSPEKINGLKISFVFVDNEIFDRFITSVKDAKLNNEMTAILIDIESFQIVKEVWIPGGYECLSNISIFEMPVPIQEDDILEDEFYLEGEIDDEI